MDKKQLIDFQQNISLNSKIFVEGLLQWDQISNTRAMPWKGEKDPYKIWLSEIILQQTRVEQGRKYYENFISNFPAVASLANAPEEKIFKLWEGLGYYSRCRNLIGSAKFIHQQLSGKFPDKYEDILALKGVGAYTAAAIASFAYNLPYAVVDGNVLRVLSRIFAIPLPVDSPKGRQFFNKLAQEMLPDGSAGIYNQAIMDFGATVCKPLPDCNNCFFNHHCSAFKTNMQGKLPVKEKKLKIRNRHFHYFFLIHDRTTAVRCRLQKDIWQNLFEFPVIESDFDSNSAVVAEQFIKDHNLKAAPCKPQLSVNQKLTHQQLKIHVYTIQVEERPVLRDFQWIGLHEISNFAFPRTLARFLQQHEHKDSWQKI